MFKDRKPPHERERISVKDLYESFGKELKMRLVMGENGLDRIVREKSINRPSLSLTGYFKNFAAKRIQLFGAGEMSYLRDIGADKQYEVLTKIAELGIPCMVVSRDLVPTRAMRKVAKEQGVPLIISALDSREFITKATVLLERRFAPRVTLHGTFIDIKGIGTLLRGKSGVGKSECALALIERGYSLVADDAVYVKNIGDEKLTAKGSHLNFGYMEVRGLGIINIAELFGVRSVRIEKDIDLVVTFKEWHSVADDDRTGLEQEYHNILGLDIPHIQIHVRPGRDLGRLVETAAMVQALKRTGHDPAKEFNDKLISYMASKSADAEN